MNFNDFQGFQGMPGMTNQFFEQQAGTTVTNLPPQINNLPPIITRRVNIVNRPIITNQLHILEDITQINNQHIKRHFCVTKPSCCETHSHQEVNCCNTGCNAGGQFLGNM